MQTYNKILKYSHKGKIYYTIIKSNNNCLILLIPIHNLSLYI